MKNTEELLDIIEMFEAMAVSAAEQAKTVRTTNPTGEEEIPLTAIEQVQTHLRNAILNENAYDAALWSETLKNMDKVGLGE